MLLIYAWPGTPGCAEWYNSQVVAFPPPPVQMTLYLNLLSTSIQYRVPRVLKSPQNVFDEIRALKNG